MKKYIFTTFLFLMFPLQSASFAHPELCYWQDGNGVRIDLSEMCGVSQASREVKSKDLLDTAQKVSTNSNR